MTNHTLLNLACMWHVVPALDDLVSLYSGVKYDKMSWIWELKDWNFSHNLSTKDDP